MANLFYVDKSSGTPHPGGGIAYYTPMPFRSLALVKEVWCKDGKRRTAQVTGEPDTFFSIPARVKVGGKTVTGYVTISEEHGYEFRAVTYRKNWRLLEPKEAEVMK